MIEASDMVLRVPLTLLVLVACGGCGGDQKPTPETPKGEASESTDKKLDCAFVRNLENCWRKATAKLGACLGGKPMTPGKFQKDDPSLCTAEEIGMKLREPCDPDTGKCDVNHVFLGKGDKKCAELEIGIDRPATEENRGAGTVSMTTAEGVVKLEYDEKQKTVVCPDGSRYTGSGDWKKELADCADDTGYQGIPGWSLTATPSSKDGKKKVPGKVALEIASMDVVLECQKP
jgi:hypothetical protein